MLAALVFSKAVLEVVHCTAGPFAFHVLASVEDTENVLGVVCHHAEECSDPHPENSAGTSETNRCGNACDIARTDRCGKSRAESLKLGNASLLILVVALLVEYAAACLLPPVSDMRKLEKLSYDRH